MNEVVVLKDRHKTGHKDNLGSKMSNFAFAELDENKLLSARDYMPCGGGKGTVLPVLPEVKYEPTVAECELSVADSAEEQIQSNRLEQKLFKLEALSQSIERVKKDINWTEMALSRHVVTQRSIYVVLDSHYDHYKMQAKSLELAAQIFRDLD